MTTQSDGQVAEDNMCSLSAKADGVWGAAGLQSERHDESQDANHGQIREGVDDAAGARALLLSACASSGCTCRLLPRSHGLPQMAGGSASTLSLSRPAQASLTLRPAGLLSRLKRPLSRGFSPTGYQTKPLVSYQINRQLSGWNPPPLVIRAFGAHCQQRTSRLRCASK